MPRHVSTPDADCVAQKSYSHVRWLPERLWIDKFRGGKMWGGAKISTIVCGSNFWTLVQVTVDAKLLGRSGSASCGKLESKNWLQWCARDGAPALGGYPSRAAHGKNYRAGYAHPKPLICIQRHGWPTSVEWALALDSHIRRTEHSMSNESTCIEICLSASHLATMTLLTIAKINKNCNINLRLALILAKSPSPTNQALNKGDALYAMASGTILCSHIF